MRNKLFILVFVALAFSACGDDSKEDVVQEQVKEVKKDSLSTIEGDFIYLADAAVLKGKNFIYGVQLDSISQDLAQRVAPLKQDDFDMISVKVKAKVIPNPGREGWDEIVQIREVLEIMNPQDRKVRKKLDTKEEEQD